MPLLIALIGIIAAAYFWANRTRQARNAVGSAADMAHDVRLAARRFGFTRQMNIHPVESSEEPRLAIAAIATSFIELDDLPTVERREKLVLQVQSHLNADAAEAEEMAVLGRWFMTECGGAQQAISRISRKLYKLGGSGQIDLLLAVLQGAVGDGELSARQRDAVEDIHRALRPR